VAQYKLIQDIEAEDKILGPLTLRQFIFALAAAFLFYICFVVVVKHVFFLLVLFLPPALFCAFFAVPFGRDQPTEIWFLAKLRFWFKPRRRIWNQSGVKELVTITVPKKVERVLTKGFSQTEVKSRLKALADTLDSRGWAVKHVNEIDAYARPVVGTGDSDRLIDIGSLPNEVPVDDVMPGDDILDEANNPIARQFETMIDQSSRSHRQRLIAELDGIREGQDVRQAEPPANNWFMGQGQAVQPAGPVPVAAAASSDNDIQLAANLTARANSRQVSLGNLRTVQPLMGRAATTGTAAGADSAGSLVPPDDQTVANGQATVVTAPGDPAILSLAKNDDFNVATLARQARKTRENSGQSPDEVIISLH
jgi:hypothetical protein